MGKGSSLIMKKIAIIGCGASGTMILANLVKIAKNAQLDITIYHSGTPIARGIAYSTNIDGHLLNVVASDMGAWADNKNDFYDWLEINYPNQYNQKSFVSRKIFGKYLEDILNNAKIIALEKNLKLTFINQELTTIPNGFDHICLSLGNKLKKFNLPEQQVNLNTTKHIAIAGTGLSMIDYVISLQEQNYTGKISLISRHGNLPYAYSFDTDVAVENTVAPGDNLEIVLDKYYTMVNKCGDWRSVINSFRPHCNAVWQAWSVADRLEFLSKYNSDWGVKRHKIAVEVDLAVRNYFSTIDVVQIKSTINDVYKDDGYTITFKSHEAINCDAVVNCMGLDLNVQSHPIYADMLKNNLIEASLVKTGIIPPPLDHVHVIGSSLVGHLFESIAIPELRHQAYSIAAKIIGSR